MKLIQVGTLVKLNNDVDNNIWIVIGVKSFKRSTGCDKTAAVRIKCMTDEFNSFRATRADDFWWPARRVERLT
jgi:hypothetical protein